MMTKARPGRSSRRRLFATTALAAGVLHAPLAAADLPTGGVVASGTVARTLGGSGNGTAGTPFVTAPADAALSLEVTGTKAVVNWDQFQVAAGKVLTFTNATPATAFSVLNRVNGGGDPTVIAGTLQGAVGGKGTIWVLNEAGVSVAGGRVLNLDGFVASTLKVTDDDFNTDPATGYRFFGTGTQPITVDATGSIVTTSGPIILVAPRITSAGTISAGGDTGLIVAADASVRLAGNSIIGVRIAAGSPLGANALSITGGSVGGSSVYAVAVTTADVIGTLLNVGGAITATASAGGVVLSAGLPASNVSFDPALVPFGGDVTIGVAPAAGSGGTEVRASRDVVTATAFAANLALRDVEAGRDIILTSTGTIAVAGTVASLRDYKVAGAAVTLGSAAATAAAPVTQSAGRDIAIRSTAAAITAVGTEANAVVLTANSDGAGGGTLTLDSFAAITGGAKLVGGTPAERTNVRIRLNTATSPITIGDVTGNQLGSIDYVVPADPTSGYGTIAAALTTAGPITLGTVTTVAPLTLRSTGGNVVVAAANSTGIAAGAVDIRSDTGDVALGSASSGFGDIVVAAAAAKTATVSGTIDSARDYKVTGGTVTLGSATATAAAPVLQSARRDIAIRSTAGAITALGTEANALALTANSDGTGGGALTLDSFTTIAGGAKLVGGTPAERTDVRIRLGTTASAVTIGDVNANQLGSIAYVVPADPDSGYGPIAAAFTTAGPITLGTVTTVAPLTLRSTGGTVVVATANSTSITAGAVDIRSDTGDVTLGSARSGFGDIVVTAAAAVKTARVTGTVDSARDYSVTGGTVVLGSAAATPLAPVVQSAVGAIGIRSTGGAIDALGTAPNALVLAAARAGGPGGLTLRSAAAITGGAKLTSGTSGTPRAVVVTLDDATRPVTLGDVTGLSLTTAAAAFTTAGAITLGTVTTVAPLTIRSTGGDVVVAVANSTSPTTGAVDIRSDTGDVTVDSATSGFGDIVVTAAAAAKTATVSGAIDSARDYGVTGGTVVLGSAAATAAVPVVQSGRRDVAIRSTTGAITARAAPGESNALVLNANRDGTGGGTLTLDSADLIAGGAKLIGGRLLADDTLTEATDVRVRLGVPARSLTIGDVRAKRLASVDYITPGDPGSGYGPAATALTTAGAMTADAIATVDPVIVRSTGGTVRIGSAVSSGAAGAVDIRSDTADVTLGGARSSVEDVTVVATTLATVSGTVTSARDYSVRGAAVTLGATGLTAPITQSAGGKVRIEATNGIAALRLGVSPADPGALIANAAGANALAAGGLTVTAAGVPTGGTSIDGATTTLTARRVVPAAAQDQQPGVTVAVAADGGDLRLAAVDGGFVDVTGPTVIAVPAIRSSGTIGVRGVATDPDTNDTALIEPLTVTIDGAGVLTPPAADVTLSAGRGVTVTEAAVANGGTIGALSLLADTGQALLMATPAALAIDSILVESQTGAARIETARAGSIAVAGRRAGSSATVADSARAVSALTVTGPVARVNFGLVDFGDIVVAGTVTATLIDGRAPLGSIDVVADGAVTIRDASARGHVTGYGGSVSLTGTARGDDIVLAADSGSIVTIAPGGAAIAGGFGTTDAQFGSDTLTVARADLILGPQTGYGTGRLGLFAATTTLASPLTGNPLSQFGGSNLVVTGGTVTTSVATASATRDIRFEAGGFATLGEATAGRSLYAAAGLATAGDLTVEAGATLRAGDDVVLAAAFGSVMAGAALLRADGTWSDPPATDPDPALRADGSFLPNPAGGGISQLRGSNIAALASIDAEVGDAVAARDLRIEAGRDATFGTGTAGRALMMVAGGSGTGSVRVTATATAGDDLILLATGGDVLAAGSVLTATGLGPDTQGDDDLLTAKRADGSALLSPLSGGALTGLAGSNIVLSGDSVTFATGTATAARDLRIEARGTATLGIATAGRSLYAAAGLAGTGDLIVGANATAGDDLILLATGGDVLAAGSVLMATGLGPDTQGDDDLLTAKRADGSALLSPLSGGALTGLAGSNIVLSGDSVTFATGTATAARDLRIEARGTATLGIATAGRSLYAAAGLAGTGDLIVGANATAGDDLILLATGGDVLAAGSVLMATGLGPDTQGDDDLLTAKRADGSALLSPLSGGALTGLAGSNIVLSGDSVTFATGTATAARDLRIEARGTATLGIATAGRSLYAAAGLAGTGDLIVGATATAGDDLILLATGGDVLAAGSVLTATGLGPDTQGDDDLLTAKRADGSALADPSGAGALVRLAASNILVAASGDASVGTVLAETGAGRDVRLAAGGAVVLGAAARAGRDVLLLGATVNSTATAIVAGDDAVVAARGGAADVGTITTSALAIGDEAMPTDPARDLSGDPLGLPGEAALGRLDGSSIVIAATGVATARTTITSAGRYTVIGRGGVVLGDATTSVTHSAARDMLIEASVAPAGTVPLADIVLDGALSLAGNSDAAGAGDGIVFRLGNGSILGPVARVGVGRSALETLGNQGSVRSVAAVANGVKSINLGTVDAPTADLRALGDAALGEPADAAVATARFDGGFLLASRTGEARLGDASVSGRVPLMTAAELAAIDLKVAGGGGASLTSASDGLLRDITVTTVGGLARIDTATARDDIVVASANGTAAAATLTLAGAASDSEAGDRLIAATDADGTALADPYGYAGPALADLDGRNIVVSGAVGAQLATAPTLPGAHAVRVQTRDGDAVLDTAVNGAATPANTPNQAQLVFTASRTGSAMIGIAAAAVDIAALGGFDATLGTGVAGRDIFVEAGSDAAAVTTATAARDLTVVGLSGPSVTVGSGTAGDDLVVQGAGTVTADMLVATGLGTDSEAGSAGSAALRYWGEAIIDPAAAARGLTRLTGPFVNALAGSNIAVSGGGAVALGSDASVLSVSAARSVTLLSNTTLAVTGATLASAGDIVAVAPLGLGVTATASGSAQSAGGDIFDATVSGDLRMTGDLKAGRDLFAETAAGTLSLGTVLTAGRDLTLVNLGTAATTVAAGGAATAGDDLVIAGGGTVTAGTLAATGVGADSEAGSITAVALRYKDAVAIADPAGTARGLTRLTGPLVNALAGSNIAVSGGGAVTLGSDAAVLLVSAAGSVTLLSNTMLTATGATLARAGDIVAVAPLGLGVTATAPGPAQSAGGDIFDATVSGDLRVTGDLKAGRDLFAETAAGTLSLGTVLTAGRDLTLVNLGTAATTVAAGGAATAGDDLVIAGGGTVTAGTLAATGVGADSEAGSITAVALRYKDAVAIVNPAAAARADAATVALRLLRTDAALAGSGTPAITQLAGANVAVAAKGALTITGTGGSAIAAQRRITVMSDADVGVAGAVNAAASDYIVVAGKTATLGGTSQAGGTRVTVLAADLALAAGLKAGDRIELIPRDAIGGTAIATIDIGDGVPTGTGHFGLSNAELNLLAAPNLELDAIAGITAASGVLVNFGVAVVPDRVLNFAVRTTGNIVLNDKLTIATTGGLRTLVLGGGLIGGATEGGATDSSAANVYANSIQVLAATGTAPGPVKGSISAAGSTVALRANYIALGEANGLPTGPANNAPFNAGLGGRAATDPLLTQATIRANYFLNPESTFYRAVPLYNPAQPAQPIVSATGTTTGTLVIAAGKWALVQNTGVSSQLGGGIDVQRFQLVRLTATDPIVGVFGRIAGQGGFVAPVKIALTDLDGISPSNVRINGCIALQTASCIITGLAQPPLGLGDPARDLVLSLNPPAALPLELVIGASNDALWSGEEFERELDPPPVDGTPEAPTEKP